MMSSKNNFTNKSGCNRFVLKSTIHDHAQKEVIRKPKTERNLSAEQERELEGHM